jgi:exonuclease III
VRILGLNIRAGGGQRTAAIVDYLERHDPHTLVLTEWRASAPGADILAWARARRMHVGALNDGGTANGVLVASRARFGFESVRPDDAGTGVLMLARFAAFRLLACYFPSQKQKAPYFARCAEVARVQAGARFLLVGDLNTGNQVADRVEGGVRYHCAEAFDDLSAQCGLHDLWRRSQGPDAREWTWLSHRQNGFRLDHAFANAAFVAWARPDCRYDHAPRGTFSDHSAIVVDCGPGGRRQGGQSDP